MSQGEIQNAAKSIATNNNQNCYPHYDFNLHALLLSKIYKKKKKKKRETEAPSWSHHKINTK